MRLAAISFYSDGPVHAGFVSLGDVTALVGANDVGKTRLLGMIERALRDPDRCDMIDLFAIASVEEVDEVVDPEAVDRFGIGELADQVAGFAGELEPPALADGVRVGIRLPGEFGHLSAWRYGRCPAELDDTLSDAVQDALEDFTPDRAFAPVKLEYLGEIDPRALPEPVVVPSAPGEIQREVGRVATALAYVLRELAARWEPLEPGDAISLSELRLDLNPPTSERDVAPVELAPDEPDPDWISRDPSVRVDQAGELTWGWLIAEDQDASRVHPAAVVACQALQNLAGGLLPSFITTDYRLEITPGQPTEIAQRQPVGLGLLRLDTVPDWLDDADGLRFDLEHAASGYRLWIELALHETMARARTLIHILHAATHCLRLADFDELDVDLDDVRAVARATLGHLRDPRSPAPTTIDTVLDGAQKHLDRQPDDPDPGLFARPRPRLYLVDEPEQRLHPRLQRRAARWLTTLMSEWDTQCVLATHSVAFLNPSGHTHTYQITRTDEPDHAEIEPLDPATLTPYADLAQTIGLDRGELLTRWRAFVFADPLLATILDNLAGDQLQRSDIRLIPLPPPGDHPPPEITLLADLTSAPLVLLLTQSPADQIAQLGDHPAPNRPPGDGVSAETASAAAVLDLATQLELDIEILPLTIGHPLDLLHPDAIRRCVSPRPHAPVFPGHDHAHHLQRPAARLLPRVSPRHLRDHLRPRHHPNGRADHAPPPPPPRPTAHRRALANRAHRPRRRKALRLTAREPSHSRCQPGRLIARSPGRTHAIPPTGRRQRRPPHADGQPRSRTEAEQRLDPFLLAADHAGLPAFDAFRKRHPLLADRVARLLRRANYQRLRRRRDQQGQG
jgi:energy-coupling factor transporter ATP-binding protein EcfA2